MNQDIKKHNSSIMNIPKNDYEEPIFKTLIIVAIPIVLYLLFQHIANIIDYFIAGNPKDIKTLDGAISYTKSYKRVIQSIAVSLSSVGVIFVSREYKKKNKEKIQQYANLTFFMATIFSVGISLFFYIGASLPIPILNKFFFAREYHNDGGFEYFVISLFTFIFITINVVFIGLQRSTDKKKFVTILNVCYIFLRVMFSIGYRIFKGQNNLGLIDFAFADFFSNLLFTLFVFYYLLKIETNFKLTLKNIKCSKDTFKTMLILSFTLIAGKATYEFGKHFNNGLITTWENGKSFVSIVGFVALVNGIFYNISQAFEDAQSVMVSQSVVNNNNQKTLKIFKNVFLITFLIGIFGFIMNYFLGEQILRFIKPEKKFSEDDIEQFKFLLNCEQISLFTSIWSNMMMGYIVAYTKKANIFFWINLIRIIIRTLLLYFLHYLFTNVFVLPNRLFINSLPYGLGTFFSNFIVFIIAIFLFVSFIKKNKNSKIQN